MDQQSVIHLNLVALSVPYEQNSSFASFIFAILGGIIRFAYPTYLPFYIEVNRQKMYRIFPLLCTGVAAQKRTFLDNEILIPPFNTNLPLIESYLQKVLNGRFLFTKQPSSGLNVVVVVKWSAYVYYIPMV